MDLQGILTHSALKGKNKCGVAISHYLHSIMLLTNNLSWAAVGQRAEQSLPSNFICTMIILAS